MIDESKIEKSELGKEQKEIKKISEVKGDLTIGEKYYISPDNIWLGVADRKTIDKEKRTDFSLDPGLMHSCETLLHDMNFKEDDFTLEVVGEDKIRIEGDFPPDSKLGKEDFRIGRESPLSRRAMIIEKRPEKKAGKEANKILISFEGLKGTTELDEHTLWTLMLLRRMRKPRQR